jgi:hypothetical protein
MAVAVEAKTIAAALARIPDMTDPERLRAVIANARRQNVPDVERAAFARLCEIAPAAAPGTIAHDVWKSIGALEEMLRDERGKTVRLSRTRQKIARDGEVKTAADLTLRTTASDGFNDLIARGHPGLTFEAVVLRHPGSFAPDVRDAAAQRLTASGIDVSTLIPGGQ